MNRVGKLLVGLVLLVVGFVGLLMSLCGGAFLIWGVFQHQLAGVFLIALGSLVVGGGIAYGCFKGVQAVSWRDATSEKDSTPD